MTPETPSVRTSITSPSDVTVIRRVMRPLPFAFPFPNEGRNALVGAVISQLHQIGVHQLRRPAFFA